MTSGQMLSSAPMDRSMRNSGPIIASTGKNPASRMKARMGPAPRMLSRARA